MTDSRSTPDPPTNLAAAAHAHPSARPGHRHPVARYVGGVSVGGGEPWSTNRATTYRAMASAHATWIRADIGWEHLEPTAGTWRFDIFDPIVADVHVAGMRFLAILHTVPSWANGGVGNYARPTDLSLVVDYAYRVARHYLPLGVTEFEIGNEVNLPHPGWETPSGAAYVPQYLRPAVAGVRKAAAELGTTATVLFGSLAPTEWNGGTDPTRFLLDAYDAGAAGLFDALGWHPYTGAVSPTESAHMNTDPGALYSIMAAHDDGAKKIWATEYGQATGGPYAITERAQADLVSQALPVWYAKPYAGPLFWYSGRDSGRSTTDREQHFGLLRYDGTPKPAYSTLAGLFTR